MPKAPYFPRHHLRNKKLIPASRNSQRVPKPRKKEFTKSWGLAKLRLLVRGEKGVRVLPHVIITEPSAADRINFSKNRKRILIRMDEKGREYRRLPYSIVPRIDVTGSKKISSELKKMRTKGDPHRDPTGKLLSTLKKHGRFIIHPTHEREEVYWTGRAVLKYQNDVPTVTVQFGLGEKQSTYFHHGLAEFTYAWKEGALIFQPSQHPSMYPRNSPFIEPMMESLLRILKKGLDSRQLAIKKNGYIELGFNTWKEDPTLIEFYDLKERRNTK